LAATVVSFSARQPKSTTFSGWPMAQLASVPTADWWPSSVMAAA
jgi:hypothetical protein